jgi:hypothetical protein
VASTLDSLLGQQGTVRRLLFGLLGSIPLALNHKLGLGLTETEQGIWAGFIATIILGSNVKEATIGKAQASAAAPSAQAGG